MSQPHSSADLPPGRRLSRTGQLRLLALVAAGLVLLFLLVALVHRLTSRPEAAEAVSQPGSFRPSPSQLADLRIETVRTGADLGGLSATGTISVDEDRSTPVVLPYSGQVGEVLVQAGQHVVRGQPLLKIASSDFVDARNALFAAAAQRSTATAQLSLAEQNEKRQAAIYQTAGGAQKDFRQAESDLVAAKSSLRSAEAALGAARDKLTLLGKSPAEIAQLETVGEVTGIYAQTTYHAPVAGTIATRDVAPGQYVSAGGDKPVMVIADLSRVWLIAQIDQSAAAKVRLGDTVEVTTPAFPGRIFHATVDNIGAALDPNTHRLPVRATVANPDEALKPGMFATFAIHRPTDGTSIVIPASAVIHEGDGARVWVERPGGLLVARPVTVTDSAGGLETISAGLSPGERVVTAGAIFVNEAGLGE